MPAIAAAPLFYGALASGAAGVATGVIGSRAQSGASKRASAIQQSSDAASIAEARAQRAEEQRQFDAQQALTKAQFDAQEEQRLHDRALADAKEARQAPYRAASQAALGRLGDILGFNVAGGGGQAPIASNAWLSPSQVGRRMPPVDPNQPQTMGTLMGMR